MKQKRLRRGSLAILFTHSRQLENYSDDLIWRLDRIGSYSDDILKLVDDYGEAFTRQLGADDLSRLGRLVNEGLSDDVVDAVIWHVDYFADYSDDTIKKIAESGCNAERILTQIDNYAKDFTEDLTAGQLKRLDDILEQGITQEQFEVLLKHGNQLDDYTDEVIGLWRDYAGNGDDFLKLVDEFGDEFVEAFRENGDEAVEKCSELLRGEYDRIVFNLAQQVPDSYKANLKCVEFADALQQLIEKEGVCGERIYIQSATDYIVSDKYGTISYNGRHEAIKIGNVIYDNLNPLGIDYYEWMVDLGITDYPMMFELQRELIGVK